MGTEEEVKVEETEEKSKFKSYGIGFFKAFSLVALLYFFICSLTFLEDAFKLVSGKSAGNIFNGDIMSNPIVGLMIGILFTVLVQSSSTCTSVIVSMVASGTLSVKTAIPMVMGANIGTSMTSTLVSLTQVTDVVQFERAFSAATVHDCFNWLSVITLLTVELSTHYLYHMTSAIMGVTNNTDASDELDIPNVLAYITEPFTDLVIQIDPDMLTCWGAKGCQNETTQLLKDESFLFNIDSMSDQTIGIILLVISLLILSTCLVLIVKVLRSSLEGTVAELIRKFVNADIKYVPWLTGYLALFMGAGLTFVVQSSSVFTSTLTPLVGVGLIEVERMYPLVLGSNIGTTSTAILAAFATGQKEALQIALCHFFFNISGILLFYPIPFTRFPLTLCRILGRTTARYRWFAIFYLFMMFCFIPAAVLGLSIAGTIPLAIVGIPLVLIGLFAVVVNIMMNKCPQYLPKKMQTWNWLPFTWMYSLDPLDVGCMWVLKYCCICCPDFYNKLKTELPPSADEESGHVITDQPKKMSIQSDDVEDGHVNKAFEITDEAVHEEDSDKKTT